MIALKSVICVLGGKLSLLVDEELALYELVLCLRALLFTDSPQDTLRRRWIRVLLRVKSALHL